MADANSIVARLERVSLGLDALEKIGELADAAHLGNVPPSTIGAPVAFIASSVHELLCDAIQDLKRPALEVAHG